MLRVTFDSNVWEHIVDWQAYAGSNQEARKEVNAAIRSGEIAAYISERTLTVEALKRATRAQTFIDLAEHYIDAKTEMSGDGYVTMEFSFNNVSERHPGAHPVLSDRLLRAAELGIKILPDRFLGATRPREPDLSPFYVAPADHLGRSIDEILDEDAMLSKEIAERGVGRGRIEAIASRIQRRLDINGGAWFDGLDRAENANEQAEIAAAFGEMVDGDIVAAHIAYRFDVLCSQDYGAGRVSIFDGFNREWLAERYGVKILNVTELADQIRKSRGS